VVLALSATLAFAQDVVLKPFVLASSGPGDLTQILEQTNAALTKAGFAVAGSYAPGHRGQVAGRARQGGRALTVGREPRARQLLQEIHERRGIE